MKEARVLIVRHEKSSITDSAKNELKSELEKFGIGCAFLAYTERGTTPQLEMHFGVIDDGVEPKKRLTKKHHQK